MPPKKVNTLFDGGDKSGGGNKGTKKTDNKKPGKWSNVYVYLLLS
jgi:hypothetical protein